MTDTENNGMLLVEMFTVRSYQSADRMAFGEFSCPAGQSDCASLRRGRSARDTGDPDVITLIPFYPNEHFRPRPSLYFRPCAVYPFRRGAENFRPCAEYPFQRGAETLRPCAEYPFRRGAENCRPCAEYPFPAWSRVLKSVLESDSSRV